MQAKKIVCRVFGKMNIKRETIYAWALTTVETLERCIKIMISQKDEIAGKNVEIKCQGLIMFDFLKFYWK